VLTIIQQLCSCGCATNSTPCQPRNSDTVTLGNHWAQNNTHNRTTQHR